MNFGGVSPAMKYHMGRVEPLRLEPPCAVGNNPESRPRF